MYQLPGYCSLGMKIIILVFLCLSLVQGKKEKLKHDEKKMKKCSAALDDIQSKIDKLREDLERVKKCLNTSDPDHKTYCVGPSEESFSSTGNQVPSGRAKEVAAPKDRSTAATTADTFAIGDMYLNQGEKCGPQTITGWGGSLDIYYDTSSTADSTNVYVSTGSGTYTAPVTGYYNICAFLRFKKWDNGRGGYGDVTIVAGGSTVAGFGDAVRSDWRSTGTCLIRRLTAGQTVYIRNNSGDSKDCVEETNYRYGRLAVYMVGPE